MPGVPDIKLIRTDTIFKENSTTLVPQGQRGVCVCEVLQVILIEYLFIFFSFIFCGFTGFVLFFAFSTVCTFFLRFCNFYIRSVFCSLTSI